ncbi:MAG: hypothetical protein ABSC37_17145 [Xanthobacteraceae bacterium]
MDSALFPIPPRIRLRIGVSGHRVPPKLPKQSEAPIRALLDRVLALVVDTARKAENDYKACVPTRYAGSSRSAAAADLTSKFVIVSSVAEGSDRIVAEAGLAAGFALEVVLPLGRAEYARDFETQASRAHYQQLLDRASAVFELDGAAEERARAYEAAGFVMLANIDLLIAIWDGQEAAGIGGTAQIVSRAIADGIPIVWIDPASPNAMKLSWSSAGDVPPANANARPNDTFQFANEAQLADVIAEIVSLPKPGEARNSLKRYLGETERRWNFCPWYPLLLWLFARRPLRWSDFHLAPSLAESKAQWQDYLTILPKDRAQRPAIEKILLPAFSAADHIAVYYSHVYRSSYVFNFLFAALAVALALGGVFTHDPDIKSYLVIVELVDILAVLATWLLGRHKQWHRRWLGYRRLADCVRHMRILAPIGSEGSVERPGRSLGVDEEDWINWYAWSLRRLLPLPDCAVDHNYLVAMRDAVRSAEIAGQIQYHSGNAARIAKLDHRIHLTGEVVFLITAVLCISFVTVVYSGTLRDIAAPIRDLILAMFTFLTALLPTLGAALGAIHVQGDFRTVAEQSGRTAKRLAAIDKILEDEPLIFARLADRIEKTSDVMMSDLLEWHTVFRTRPLSLPA